MLLKLRNIGMIREADVHIDGLTVIAGENDTGKSTVGKSLFALAKARLFANGEEQSYLEKIEWLFQKISRGQLLQNDSSMVLDDIEVDLSKQRANPGNKKFLDAIFIETPFIFNLYRTLTAISKANSVLDFDIPYNYLWWDLYIKLSQKAKTFSKLDFTDIKKEIERQTKSRFKRYETLGKDKWVMLREEKEIEMENVAMGIKQFVIIYALIENGYLTSDRIIIFDEPEVHLHPKWQLKMAEIIVALVKNGVKIIVNSHSPYMIEALQRYSETEKIRADFYLAEDGYIRQIENSNSKTLSKIFSKLSEPFDIFDQMDSDRLQNG